ncbi:phosphatases II [Rhizopus microsporus var. microsporus]|uniref:protein-tyrosine-phosphatase n=2 Tax=Rhizopus microsporus TaxID=58291 RepID=A0A2G4SYY8_RHIZD|nr:phosphatases II [Rhizopus microsporus ATCC 52813]ORE11749.1 phosphatases II [Rhizopus microsporus var. microsporus]PHZ13999.1 phosphatases II [Rhizopus microsporus ATCC 52813]
MFSVIQSPNTQQKFLLLDAPTQKTLPKYVQVFKQENVSDLVCICHRPSGDIYDTEELEQSTGIKVHDTIKFEDGSVPDQQAIDLWLELSEKARQENTTIGVHCIAGIGRAPVLVAISLIEAGMDPLDAISYIRKHRRGALNKNQVRFLDSYKKKGSKRKKLFGLF